MMMWASILAYLVVSSTASGLDSSSCPAIQGSGGSAGKDNFLDEDPNDAVSLLQYDAYHIQGANLARLGTPDPETGIWQAEDLKGRKNGGLNHCVADHLLGLMGKMNSTSVLDLGAGSGAYSMYLKDHLKWSGVQCCDGNPAVVDTSGGLCSVCDLTTPQQDMKPADFVFSLEVAEHIPPEKEALFLNNLESKSTNLLVLSWGVLGQHGNGHVNLRPNEYVIQKMIEAGFAYCAGTTKLIRDTVSFSPCKKLWNSRNFRKSLMVFSKGDACQL